MTFNGQSITGTLHDNPSSRDFYAMLPLDLEIEDYSTNEKIVHLPRKLTTEGKGPFGDERPGDIAYWSPWGNLVFYYDGYRYDPGLIRLGRCDGSFDMLRRPGRYPVHLERIE
ncbi:MFS transporter [Devosia nitrariae]|uniref:MFS transporter n=2 Tax=Devosia nitrariae TaxID=2071872 RepID=A0ABQ5W1P8_9HYPH|nr:MFS transporter [Devosia nitrariae]